MEILKINGVDYGDYVPAVNGLRISSEERGTVEIVTAAGGLFHRYAARKRRLDVMLDMVPEEVLDVLEHDLAADSFPVITRGGGGTSGGMFTADPAGVAAQAAVILGGVLYYTGVTFTLREV